MRVGQVIQQGQRDGRRLIFNAAAERQMHVIAHESRSAQQEFLLAAGSDDHGMCHLPKGRVHGTPTPVVFQDNVQIVKKLAMRRVTHGRQVNIGLVDLDGSQDFLDARVRHRMAKRLLRQRAIEAEGARPLGADGVLNSAFEQAQQPRRGQLGPGTDKELQHARRSQASFENPDTVVFEPASTLCQSSGWTSSSSPNSEMPQFN
jgi:hypothetical protein